ncbi:MAG: D-alanyl-D-alanine carboxypeptidase [Clostridia bacterium]|nr:D-alanyl-D-alanine carboxypeptidase [Clostridia bacterium]MBQ7339206.1 D-alanyl-D-alanine carboxypeptidase [Clostridia bacterium]
MSSHPSNHPNHYESHELDRGSPVNMLWGLILTILTFLLVVVCVLSIDIFADAAEDDGPDDQQQENLGDDPIQDPSHTDDPIEDPDKNPEGDLPGNTVDPPTPGTPSTEVGYLIKKTAQTQQIDSEFLNSANAILVDVESREIVAGYDYDMPVYPASMTKIMTLLVACEMLTEEQLTDVITVSAQVVEYMQRQGASGVGFSAGEELTIRDLLYAVALESDGIAAAQLAIYLAGSEENFVALMNAKAEEMGLISTTFKNCTGLHHDEHISTCREIASIMLAALENEQVKTLLSAKTYDTTTKVYPNGVTFLSTYYNVVDSLRKSGIPYQPSTGTIIMAKTGLTDEAKYCLATAYERAIDGKQYVVVTTAAINSYTYVMDYIMIYDEYAR